MTIITLNTTQMLGIAQTIRVHPSKSTGNNMSVLVNPKFLIIKPVPKRENRNDIELVVYENDSKRSQLKTHAKTKKAVQLNNQKAKLKKKKNSQLN